MATSVHRSNRQGVVRQGVHPEGTLSGGQPFSTLPESRGRSQRPRMCCL